MEVCAGAIAQRIVTVTKLHAETIPSAFTNLRNVTIVQPVGECR